MLFRSDLQRVADPDDHAALDGTAKGGVIIGICDALKIPVRYVGLGEKVADLKEFDAHQFVVALFEG